MFELVDNNPQSAIIKVVGVGGGGGNAVEHMLAENLDGVEFICLNTDAQALQKSSASKLLQLGDNITKGLGAGADPDVGRQAALADRERIVQFLQGADMVFITAGMGGGTGTGAAPVVAEIARELDILTVAVVTKPFDWEGPVRDRNAQGGLENLRRWADTVIVVPNQKLMSVVEKTTSMKAAFAMADEVLISAVRGISEIILKHGEIQVDFADVRTIMSQGGDALMGMGRAKGENKAVVAADRAIHSPLLDNVNITGATGVLVNITGGDDLGMMDVNDAMNTIYTAVGTDVQANIIFGTVINPDLTDEIAITVIATGFSSSKPAGQRDALRRPAISLTPRLNPVADAAPDAEPMDDAMEKVPFGAGAGSMSPAMARADESASSRRGANAFRSRTSYADPDIDYETPAFLRNQAD